MNKGHHILKTKYGNPDDWCLMPTDKRRVIREEGTETTKYNFYEGKEAIDYLVEYIDEKHEEGDFDRHFTKAVQALKDMMEEVYGVSMENPGEYA